MRLRFCTVALAASIVQAGIVDLNAEATVARRTDAPHTTYHTTADKPTQSGIAANCNKFYDIVKGDDCETVAAAFKITKTQFLAWNPAVSADCATNFWVGDSYCVGTGKAGVGSTKSSRSTKSDAPHTTVHTKPDKPTQTGTICNCNKWYDVVEGDDCGAIATAFKIKLADFLKMNPAVSSDCAINFWVGNSYCVGTSKGACPTSTSTTPHNSTTISSSYSIIPQPSSSYVQVTRTTATSWPPTQTQAGQVPYCNKWKLVYPGDTCASIQARYSTSMSLDDFKSWNPALGANCTNLFANYYVCVGIQSQISATHNTTATSQWYPPYTPTVHPTPNSTFVPSPTQSGIPPSCMAFYQATANDTCESIIKEEGYVSLDELKEYNPALGSDCSGLIPGDYYCVMNGTLPLPSVATAAPSATQTGITPDCVSWYRADSGEDCDLVVKMFGTFSAEDFLKWNPAVKPDCSGFKIGNYYCVAIPSTPTTRTTGYSSTPLPTNGVGPQPEQSGIPEACADYWFVGSLDTCDSIATKNNITVAQLESYNPALSSDCSGLTPNYYICVEMPGSLATSDTATGTTSSTSNTGTTGPTVTTGTVSTATAASTTSRATSIKTGPSETNKPSFSTTKT
ncbi:hypothetical protein V502_08694 [Pseudogymnoascus sp. VKM F-4520 (FW-2644)]|nr:hypothetical protein V502_08694 [Pseudogymnoascus sp. VKM F-4520 (FW-2644)]